jgi:L-asparaginase II
VDSISVAVRRGKLVESRHRVHAVIVRAGDVAEAWGDPGLVTFLRSAAKPIQALALVRAVPNLAIEHLAIAAASHAARTEQLEAVRGLLARAEAVEEDLECGPVEGSRLRHNCSGKHAGMLCVCRAEGWPRQGYRLPEHPLQRRLLEIVAQAAEVPVEALSTATDGCGVVTFGLPLHRMAHAFSRLVREELEGAGRVVEAMTARPDLVEGSGSSATETMRALPGAIAKGGAEGLFCVGLPDGSGVALKAEDGASRALGPAAAEVLGISALAEIPIENSRGERVGAVLVD